MTPYLLNSSALWYLLRTPGAVHAWQAQIGAGAFRLAEPTRAEFLVSATGPAHRDELAGDLDTLCLPATVPKTAWRWVDTAQYTLTQHGLHHCAGPLDLLLCATAVHDGLTVLHMDNDFATVGAVLKDVQIRDIRS